MSSKPSASCSYLIADNINYSHLSPSYQAYLSKLSSQVEPKIFKQASQDDRWVTTMINEIGALESNNSWEIVDLPPGKKGRGSKWFFKIKHKAYGTVDKYKGWLQGL